jgi:NAD(P)-dependent dehydrogenase (short-subunit alcohol dehydrogenase family)
MSRVLAVEAGHFGISVTLLQPGAVSSGALDRVPTYLGDDDPYLPLARQLAGARGSFITVEEVAAAVADALEQDSPPLRIPVGAPAAAFLAARAATPEGTPFRIAPLEW